MKMKIFEFVKANFFKTKNMLQCVSYNIEVLTLFCEVQKNYRKEQVTNCFLFAQKSRTEEQITGLLSVRLFGEHQDLKTLLLEYESWR